MSFGGGAGGGGTTGTGLSVGYSKEQGLTFGAFESKSIGSYFGGTFSATLNISVDSAKGVSSGKSETMSVGGSGGVGLVGGAEISKNLKDSGGAITGNIGVGVGTPEGHILYTTTNTKATSMTDIACSISNKIEAAKNELFTKIVEGVPKR